MILTINRRHAKKFSSAFDDQAQPESEKGYESFKEVAKDIEVLVDILWVTGTRMFICYLPPIVMENKLNGWNESNSAQRHFKYHILSLWQFTSILISLSIPFLQKRRSNCSESWIPCSRLC
jgi:hypothetical protein